MKKIKLTSFFVLAVIVASSIIMPLISKADEQTSVSPSDYNGYSVLLAYAQAAVGAIDDANKSIEEYFVNIESVQDKKIIKFESDDNNSCLSDDTLSTDDAYILQTYFSAFVGTTTSTTTDTYTNMKTFFKEELNTDLTDFSLEYQIVGTNGKTLNASISDSESNTFLNQGYCTVDSNDNEEIKTSVCENIAKELDASDLFNSTRESDTNNQADALTYVEEVFKSSDYVKKVSIKCVAGGKNYYFVMGYSKSEKNENGCYKVNAYFISEEDAEEEQDTKFKTTLNYDAYVDKKSVGGTTSSDGVYSPNYDKDNVKKDADVTATIKSETDEDIVAVNGIDLPTDGTANKDGWYYVDASNKKEIAKVYEFDTYDNSTANGKVSETVTLTGADGNTDKQNVSIKWPFRITDVTYDPDQITDDTDTVKVTITTNLPMDSEKIPDGWTIVPDTENHKITKTFDKGNDINTDVTVYQNGTGETDKTSIKIEWPSDEKKDDTVAKTSYPNTGEKITILSVIAILIVAGVITRKKMHIKK